MRLVIYGGSSKYANIYLITNFLTWTFPVLIINTKKALFFFFFFSHLLIWSSSADIPIWSDKLEDSVFFLKQKDLALFGKAPRERKQRLDKSTFRNTSEVQCGTKTWRIHFCNSQKTLSIATLFIYTRTNPIHCQQGWFLAWLYGFWWHNNVT